MELKNTTVTKLLKMKLKRCLIREHHLKLLLMVLIRNWNNLSRRLGQSLFKTILMTQSHKELDLMTPEDPGKLYESLTMLVALLKNSKRQVCQF